MHLDKISIHALTRSATKELLSIYTGIIISIHALTRSATTIDRPLTQAEIISIHALTRSATLYSQRINLSLTKFQSTHSRGVRLGSPKFCGSLIPDFNPRTHEECDSLSNALNALTCFISIHALTRSATSSSNC